MILGSPILAAKRRVLVAMRAEVKPMWEQGFKEMTNEEVVQLIHEFNGDAVPFMDYPSTRRPPTNTRR